MTVRTHLGICASLVGTVSAVGEGFATASLTTGPEMVADAQGLVHGGFVFGLADYAAMVAVNDPYVVLGGAECRFSAPVRVGETLLAEARVRETEGKKRQVDCRVLVEDRVVFTGTFTCFVLPRHVLDA